MKAFANPVVVLVGLGFPRAVATVAQAWQVLNEWPGSRRSNPHAVALDVCRLALLGTHDVETARDAFDMFARAYDILAPEAVAANVVGERHAEKLGPTSW